MFYCLRDAIARAHVCDRVLLLQGRRKAFILDDLHDTLSELSDTIYFLRLGGFEMPAENSFLRMPDPDIFRKRNHFRDLIDVEIATGTVVMLEQRHYRSVP